MSDARYHTMRWRRRAKAQLQHEPRCEACLRTGRVVAARIADHVEQWRRAADPDHAFWAGRLQSLCDDCHQSKRQSERHGKAWKPKVATGADGWPIGDHPWNRS